MHQLFILLRSSGIEGLKQILKRFNSEIQDENEKTEMIKLQSKSLNAGFSLNTVVQYILVQKAMLNKLKEQFCKY